ncbi:MAG: hypothetical protein HKO06_00690 [Pseudomonadales bacterium]|nr:hypothetical protein [Pseudomonadales bacterium]
MKRRKLAVYPCFSSSKPMLLLLLLACCLLTTTFAFSAEQSKQTNLQPKIGLALSGGGVKGGAHIGVLRALEEQGVTIDYIAGTSIGAVIGGMYAAGLSVDEIEQIIAAIDWDDLLSDATSRRDEPILNKRGDYNYQLKAKPGFNKGGLQLPLGLSQGQKVTQLFRRIFRDVGQVKNFDELAIPLRVVATSLETSERKVFGSGDIVNSIKASMSLPAFFAPVEIDGEYFVDGGVVANLPIDVVRDMGADIVIAVDITDALLTHEEISSLLSVTEQLINFMTQSNVAKQVATLRAHDLLIKPEVKDIGVLDFGQSLKSIERGYRAATQYVSELQAIARHTTQAGMADAEVIGPNRPANNAPQENYRANTASSSATDRSSAGSKSSTSAERQPIIRFVEINDAKGLGKKAILARLKIPLNQPLDEEGLDKGISRLYSSGLYQHVDYTLVQRGDDNGLHIDITPKSWGPNYLQFGLQLQEDFSADANFNLSVAYLRTAINPLGGQLRSQLDLGIRQGLSVELQQPLLDSGALFTRLETGIKRTNIRLFASNNVGDQSSDRALADLRVVEVGSQLTLGVQVGTAAEFDVAIRRTYGSVDVVVGELPANSDGLDIGELSLNYRLDTLNTTNRPSSGAVIHAALIQSEKGLGAERNYQQGLLSAAGAFSLGSYRGYIYSLAGTTIEKTAPLQSQFKLGGLGRLSGLPVDRFYGQHVGLLSTNFSKTWRQSSAFPVFTGASVEAGNVWNDSFRKSPNDWIIAGSVYAGFDTFVGPVYLAAGFAENGNSTAYLYLGNPFVPRPVRPFD